MASVRAALQDAEFDELREVITARSGIEIRPAQRLFLETSLRSRLLELRLESFADYLTFLTVGPFQADEFQELLVRTHVLDRCFFRHARQLAALRSPHLQRLINARRDERHLRIWCPACSTGEEAYTIAILVHEALAGTLPDWRVEILATDASSSALEAADRSSFPISSFPAMDLQLKRRYFIPEESGHRIAPAIRSMVTLRRHSLADVLSARRFGVWDVIFCRDVIAWLDEPVRRDVLWTFHDALAADGLCVLGPKETPRVEGEPFRSADAHPRGIYLLNDPERGHVA